MEPPHDDTSATPAGSPWRWRVTAAALILLAAAVRVAYLVCNCPLDLSCDEAHYWDWSRHLDWSYYSKGPLVAWVIRAACELGEGWSRDLTGNGMAAVRLPAVLFGSLLIAGLYVLTVQSWHSERLAAAVAAVALTQPTAAAGSSLMTIDSPYTCFWVWALVVAHRAVFRGGTWTWLLTGLLIGLGILAKYTMVLFIPSLGLFLLCSPTYRGELRRRGFWLMAAVAGVCCLPILIWNAGHGWPTLFHTLGHAGTDRHGLRPLGPVEYVGVQAGLLLGFWFVAWVAALVVFRPGQSVEPRHSYLWWMSVPTFALFLAFSCKTVIQPNWPATAYISGLVLAAGWMAAQYRSPVAWYRRAVKTAAAGFAGFGLALTVLAHESTLTWPVLVPVAGPPTSKEALPLRKFDPTCRLRGWRTLAAAVDVIREHSRDATGEPVIAGGGWTHPGELGFYCSGHPAVYSFGLVLGDRHSQYDLWKPNPVETPEQFAGRTFIFVGLPMTKAVAAAFDSVGPAEVVTHYEQGQPIAQWPVYVCRGFHNLRLPGEKARH